VNGRACSNDAYLRRDLIESGLLHGIKQELLSPASVAAVRSRVTRLAKQRDRKVKPEEVERLKSEIANLTDAIATGALRSSPALAARLETAETELVRLQSATAACRGSVEQLLPGLVDEYRALVDDLATSLTTVNVARARAEIRKLVGEIRVDATADEIRLESATGLENALVREAGRSQVILVAGAGNWLYGRKPAALHVHL
jgi:hypothetical protein